MSSKSNDYWREFADLFWSKQSCSLKEPPNWKPPGPFDAIVHASEKFRLTDASVDICFWINEQKQDNFAHLLPTVEDGDFQTWDARLDRDLGGSEYTLLLANPHLYSPKVWRAVRDLTKDLVMHTGLPKGWFDTALFTGRYSKTPFGIHKGPMSVITLPVHGTKEFKVWNEGYIATHKNLINATDYDHIHDQHALTLKAEPGSAIYWPTQDWHIAKSEGKFSAALSIGVWDAPDTRWEIKNLNAVTNSLVENTLSSNEKSGHEDQSLVTEYLATLTDLTCNGTLAKSIVAEKARRESIFKFQECAKFKSDSKEIDTKSTLCVLDTVSPTVAALNDSETCIAYNGEVISITSTTGLRMLLKELESNYPISVERLQHAVLNTDLSADGASLCAILNWLREVGFVGHSERASIVL